MNMEWHFLLAAGAHPWTLGVLVCLLGLMGLGFLSVSGWEQEKDANSARSQLFDGGIVICGLMVVGPPIMLLPEEVRGNIGKEAIMVLAIVVGGGIWLFMRFGLPPLRRFFRERPGKQRRGRPSPPGQGKRARKRRK